MYGILGIEDCLVGPADVWTSGVAKKFVDRRPCVIVDDRREYPHLAILMAV